MKHSIDILNDELDQAKRHCADLESKLTEHPDYKNFKLKQDIQAFWDHFIELVQVHDDSVFDDIQVLIERGITKTPIFTSDNGLVEFTYAWNDNTVKYTHREFYDSTLYLYELNQPEYKNIDLDDLHDLITDDLINMLEDNMLDEVKNEEKSKALGKELTNLVKHLELMNWLCLLPYVLLRLISPPSCGVDDLSFWTEESEQDE